jgi:hypothetical protein
MEKIFFVSVLGRVGNSDGMTLPELSLQLMNYTNIYMAINLDGGASSRITIKDEPTQNILYLPSQLDSDPYHVGSILSFVKMDDHVPETFTNIPAGPTGVYYALRVSTDGNQPIYSNIRMSAIQLG